MTLQVTPPHAFPPTPSPLFRGLVEEDVSVIRVALKLVSGSEEGGEHRFVDGFHAVIVEEQPMVVTLHQCHVVTVVRTSARATWHTKQHEAQQHVMNIMR